MKEEKNFYTSVEWLVWYILFVMYGGQFVVIQNSHLVERLFHHKDT